MNRAALLCPVLVTLAVIAPAADTAPAGPPFADGEVVAFVGDSITHNGLWHRYVADFYATRFPGRTVRFLNNGISGDTTGGVLDRLDGDVLSHHPTVAVVMLGMNDVGRNDYKAGSDGDAAIVARRQQSLESYRKNQTTLESRLLAGGVKRLILVTPSPFDQTGKMERENLPGVNDALATCGTFIAGLAAKGGHGLVDFNGPMTALNLDRQKADPAFTLIGADRVHPGPAGHLVMAWRFLTSQGVPGVVSRIRLDGSAKAVASAEGATVSEAAWTADGVTVTVAETALPWPIDAKARPALAWAPIAQDLNREEFACTGLPPGTYALSIDGTEVGSWKAADLATGVDLAGVATTPQAVQAANVQKLCEERRALNAGLRSIAYVELKWFRGKTIDLADQQAVDRALEDHIAKGGATAGYFRTVADNYRKVKPQAAAHWQRIEELAVLITAAAQPKPHRYVLRRTGG